jgi:uncharacterized protein DUF3455
VGIVPRSPRGAAINARHPRKGERMKFHTSLHMSVAIGIAALTIAAPQAAPPVIVTPAVPSNLEPPAGSTAFLIGHARGSQNYVCLPNGSAFSWTLFGPQATLFDDNGNQQITHFLSANPVEGGAPRPTWQHSGDTSVAWAAAIRSSTDPGFVESGAIPWLLLQVVGAQYGTAFGHKLTGTTYIQRVNTAGGIAPLDGCGVATDVGRKALVPYAADYVFYRP